uniref:B30.2/SPRY domain-containing protein n=1 Tax=Globodera rostochiensis TaxID=31243 RepID=A0A914HAE2_GLORO
MRHPNLTVSGPDRLTVQFTSSHWFENSSVFAEFPIPRTGIFYYEAKILSIRRRVYVGLAHRQMPVDRRVGYFRGTYAFGSDGTFWGHAVGDHRLSAGVHPFITGRPEFGVGNTIGCGVDLANRQIIYSLNGQRLDTAGLHVGPADFLFPCVTLYDAQDKIEG